VLLKQNLRLEIYFSSVIFNFVWAISSQEGGTKFKKSQILVLLYINDWINNKRLVPSAWPASCSTTTTSATAASRTAGTACGSSRSV
jgi:hypothetical protein